MDWIHSPAFYIAFRNRWSESGNWALRWLGLPALAFCLLLVGSFLYASLAYGHSPSDYFVLPDGGFNRDTVLNHIKSTALYVSAMLRGFFGILSGYNS
ncbi:MAG: hypothetical protein IJ202_14355 [Bacteroidales bacterium]|nr:hypothetical protein [Bacteroidales bacterium]